MSVLIEEVSFLQNSSFDEMMNELVELKNHMIEKLFYSLNLNHIQIKLHRITQLPRPFIDLTYSLPNIRPQIIKLRTKLQIRKALGIHTVTLTLQQKDINFIHNSFGLPRHYGKDRYLRGIGGEIKNKLPICDELDPFTTYQYESDFRYHRIAIPYQYNTDKILKNKKKNFVNDKLIWLWADDMYADPEMDFD